MEIIYQYFYLFLYNPVNFLNNIMNRAAYIFVHEKFLFYKNSINCSAHFQNWIPPIHCYRLFNVSHSSL